MNAKRVIRRSLGEGGYASAGFAKGYGGATVVKPWGSTCLLRMWQHCMFSVETTDVNNVDSGETP